MRYEYTHPATPPPFHNPCRPAWHSCFSSEPITGAIPVASPFTSRLLTLAAADRMVDIIGRKAVVLGLRVLAGGKPWQRARTPNLLGHLREAGVPEVVAPFPPVFAFDDVEYEMRAAEEWLAPLVPAAEAQAKAAEAEQESRDKMGILEQLEDADEPDVEAVAEAKSVVEAAVEAADKAVAAADVAVISCKVLAQYLELSDSALRVLPCEVASYDASTNTYEITLENGDSKVMAPRVQVMFDGEDLQTFVDRFTAALKARDGAVQELQYKLCIKDMPTAKKGEVRLPLDKIDRVLQWTFNTDALKNGNVDTSQLLVEVYQDYVFTVNKLTFDSRREDPAMAAEFEDVQPPPAEVKPVPLQGRKVIPAHTRLQPTSVETFASTSCLGKCQLRLRCCGV